MLGLAAQGLAFPVLWQVRAQAGATRAEQSIELLRALLALLPAQKTRAVLADREFIGQSWLKFLYQQRIPFVVRLRRRQHLALGSPRSPALPAELFLRVLQVGQQRVLPECYLGQVPVSVVGKRLGPDDYLILATTLAPKEALRLYRRRGEIETLFAALKKRGFELEATHVKHPEQDNHRSIIFDFARFICPRSPRHQRW